MQSVNDQNAAVAGLPDMKISVRQVFGIDTDMEAPAYSTEDPHEGFLIDLTWIGEVAGMGVNPQPSKLGRYTPQVHLLVKELGQS